jgi:hypothetical protein
MNRNFERTYPYVIALIAGFAAWHFKVSPAPTKLDGMLTSAISVSAIFLGFLGTAKAMLLSFRSSKFSWIKSKPIVWKLLLGYLKVAFQTSLLACLYSLFLLVFDANLLPEAVKPFVIPLWVFVFTVAVVTFYRVVSVFFAILSSE